MKKEPEFKFSRSASAVLTGLLSAACLLTGCGGPYSPPPTTTTTYIIYDDSYKQVSDYRLTKCYPANEEYDLQPYKILEEDEPGKGDTPEVSELDLRRYAKNSLDFILKIDDMSARGTFQGYEVEIVRVDRFNEWRKKNGLDQTRYFNGFMTIGYDLGIADGGAYVEYQQFDVYKDTSGCFILVTACRDYKVIYEFHVEGSPVKGGIVTVMPDDYERYCFDSFYGKVCTEDQALTWSKKGNVAVMENGAATSGEGVWGAFYKSVNESKEATVLCAQYYTPDEEHAGQELYRPKLIFYYVKYHGETLDYDRFRVMARNSRGTYDSVDERVYDYMLRFTGQDLETPGFGNYDVFVLTDDSTLTWEDVKKGLESYPKPAKDFVVVYCDIYD